MLAALQAPHGDDARSVVVGGGELDDAHGHARAAYGVGTACS
jgi:hypothetical protein